MWYRGQGAQARRPVLGAADVGEDESRHCPSSPSGPIWNAPSELWNLATSLSKTTLTVRSASSVTLPGSIPLICRPSAAVFSTSPGSSAVEAELEAAAGVGQDAEGAADRDRRRDRRRGRWRRWAAAARAARRWPASLPVAIVAEGVVRASGSWRRRRSEVGPSGPSGSRPSPMSPGS